MTWEARVGRRSPATALEERAISWADRVHEHVCAASSNDNIVQTQRAGVGQEGDAVCHWPAHPTPKLPAQPFRTVFSHKILTSLMKRGTVAMISAGRLPCEMVGRLREDVVMVDVSRGRQQQHLRRVCGTATTKRFQMLQHLHTFHAPVITLARWLVSIVCHQHMQLMSVR